RIDGEECGVVQSAECAADFDMLMRQPELCEHPRHLLHVERAAAAPQPEHDKVLGRKVRRASYTRSDLRSVHTSPCPIVSTSPRTGERGRRALVRRVRGPLRESELTSGPIFAAQVRGNAPSPRPSPRKRGEGAEAARPPSRQARLDVRSGTN